MSTETELSGFSIDAFRITEKWYSGFAELFVVPTIMQTIACLTCKREQSLTLPFDKNYGRVLFRPLDHDPHCPARNHVYLEGIGPMVEPRAMVMEKTEER